MTIATAPPLSETQGNPGFAWVGNKTLKRKTAIAQILWVLVLDCGGELRDEHGGATILLQEMLKKRGVRLSRELLNNILLDLKRGYPQLYQRENTANERGTIAHRVIGDRSMLPPNPFADEGSIPVGSNGTEPPLPVDTTEMPEDETAEELNEPAEPPEMSPTSKLALAIGLVSEALIALAAIEGGVTLNENEELLRAKEELERVVAERDAARKQLAVVLAASKDVSRLLGQYGSD